MPTREACERRVYRLATLLTGNPLAATGVITAVVDAQPDLTRVESTHLDRLTVLRSRELRPGMIVADGVDSAVAEALADLSSQCREAWIFARVYRMPLRTMARAMDCSVGATERHLEQAESAMRESLGRDLAAEAPKMLLEYSMTLDVPDFYRAQQRRRRIVRLLLWALVVAVCLAVLTWILREYVDTPVLRTGTSHSNGLSITGVVSCDQYVVAPWARRMK